MEQDHTVCRPSSLHSLAHLINFNIHRRHQLTSHSPPFTRLLSRPPRYLNQVPTFYNESQQVQERNQQTSGPLDPRFTVSVGRGELENQAKDTEADRIRGESMLKDSPEEEDSTYGSTSHPSSIRAREESLAGERTCRENFAIADSSRSLNLTDDLLSFSDRGYESDASLQLEHESHTVTIETQPMLTHWFKAFQDPGKIVRPPIPSIEQFAQRNRLSTQAVLGWLDSTIRHMTKSSESQKPNGIQPRETPGALDYTPHSVLPAPPTEDGVSWTDPTRFERGNLHDECPSQVQPYFGGPDGAQQYETSSEHGSAVSALVSRLLMAMILRILFTDKTPKKKAPETYTSNAVDSNPNRSSESTLVGLMEMLESTDAEILRPQMTSNNRQLIARLIRDLQDMLGVEARSFPNDEQSQCDHDPDNSDPECRQSYHSGSCGSSCFMGSSWTGSNPSDASDRARQSSTQKAPKASRCGRKHCTIGRSRRCSKRQAGSDDENRQDGNKRPRNNESETSEAPFRTFACPYYKWDPWSTGGRISCRTPGFPTVHRMK